MNDDAYARNMVYNITMLILLSVMLLFMWLGK